MGVDFNALVLGPSMGVFARPIVVTPTKSQPGVSAYPARGIWSSRPVDVQTEDGILSSQIHTLDVRIAEFVFPIAPGDRIEVPADGSQPRIGICQVEDTDDDGQGASILSLKVVGP